MNKQAGFTLIELLICIVVIGILTVIALPSYNSYVRRSICENAKGSLLGAANLMERYRAQHNSYADAVLGTYANSPASGAAEFTLAFDAITPTTYSLTATPIGQLAGSGTLTLASTGARSATGEFQTVNAWNSCSGL